MNNIFLNDPLLQQPTMSYPQQYSDYNYIPKPVMKDWLSELDETLKHLEPNVVEELNKNSQFVGLNNDLQATVQQEMMNLIKGKLNIYPQVVENVKQQLSIISEVTNKTKEDERRSMSELNDYIKNYSNLTFDDYKKMKNGEKVEQGIEMDSKKKTWL